MLYSFLQKTTFLFLLLATFQSNAQTYAGLRGGANFSTVSKSEDKGAIVKDRATGLDLAFFADIPLGQKISLQPELHYLQKGFIRRLNDDYFYRLRYLDLPILLKFRFENITNRQHTTKRINAYLITGPYIGYGLSSKVTRQGMDTGGELGGFFKGDLGFMSGGGIALPSSKGEFMLDLRYDFGIAVNNSEGSGLPDGDLRNRGLIVSLGYAWKVSK